MADQTIPARARWTLCISAVLWFILFCGFLLALPVLLDISWLVPLAVLVVALILGLAIAALTRLMFPGQHRQSWRRERRSSENLPATPAAPS